MSTSLLELPRWVNIITVRCLCVNWVLTTFINICSCETYFSEIMTNGLCHTKQLKAILKYDPADWLRLPNPLSEACLPPWTCKSQLKINSPCFLSFLSFPTDTLGAKPTKLRSPHHYSANVVFFMLLINCFSPSTFWGPSQAIYNTSDNYVFPW